MYMHATTKHPLNHPNNNKLEYKLHATYRKKKMSAIPYVCAQQQINVIRQLAHNPHTGCNADQICQYFGGDFSTQNVPGKYRYWNRVSRYDTYWFGKLIKYYRKLLGVRPFAIRTFTIRIALEHSNVMLNSSRCAFVKRCQKKTSALCMKKKNWIKYTTFSFLVDVT